MKLNKPKKYIRGSKDLIKSYKNIYVGYSNNKRIRRNASSGGLVREIYEYLLDSNLVDGVLIVVQEYPKFYTKIARTVEELSDMENSVYAPINFGKGIKEMIEGERYAVTAIGCQNKMLSRVEHLIHFKIGLLCRGTYHESTMEAYAKSFGHKNIKHFDFRRNGWPGEIVIASDKGKYSYERRPSFIKSPKKRSVKEAYFSKATYLPKCIDCKYEFSFPSCDVSMGDAWHKKYASDTEGLTLAITRTDFAENVITDLKEKDKITCWEDSYEETNKVMDDPNIVRNLNLKMFMYKKTYLKPLMPVLVFIEEYIFNFPWSVAFKKLGSYVGFFKKR